MVAVGGRQRVHGGWMQAVSSRVAANAAKSVEMRCNAMRCRQYSAGDQGSSLYTIVDFHTSHFTVDVRRWTRFFSLCDDIF